MYPGSEVRTLNMSQNLWLVVWETWLTNMTFGTISVVCISVNFCYPNSLKKQGHNRAFKQNLDMFRLLEVSIPDKVGDGEEDEERSDVETPKEQPVDLVVEHLWPKPIFR